MSILVGKEYAKLDPSGRFKFPSELKKMLLAVVEEGFIIKESLFDTCLELYPRAVFEAEVEDKIAKLNPYNRTDRILIRKLSEGNPIRLDANDRLLLPSDQLKAKRINKDIILISKVNMIEIWGIEEYEIMNNDCINFADLAAERLGQISEMKSESSQEKL